MNPRRSLEPPAAPPSQRPRWPTASSPSPTGHLAVDMTPAVHLRPTTPPAGIGTSRHPADQRFARAQEAARRRRTATEPRCPRNSAPPATPASPRFARVERARFTMDYVSLASSSTRAYRSQLLLVLQRSHGPGRVRLRQLRGSSTAVTEWPTTPMVAADATGLIISSTQQHNPSSASGERRPWQAADKIMRSVITTPAGAAWAAL